MPEKKLRVGLVADRLLYPGIRYLNTRADIIPLNFNELVITTANGVVVRSLYLNEFFRTQRGVEGIVAEYYNYEGLGQAYIDVGQRRPAVVIIDWPEDRKRKMTRLMEKNGLSVVRYDLATTDNFFPVLEKAYGLLLPRMVSG